MKKTSSPGLPALTRVEEDVMQHIWELERCTVSDILGKLGKPAPPHSTISSIVRILEKKGYVDHKAYGRTHEYFPLVSKDGVVRNRLKSLVSNYFGGSPDSLVNFLVKEQDLSVNELRALLKKLDK